VVILIFFILSVPLCFFGVGVLVWVICIAHALAVCKVSSIDKRIDRMVKAIEGRTRTVTPSVADEPRSI
jgi:hypothetical protein